MLIPDWNHWNPDKPGIALLESRLSELAGLDAKADEHGTWNEPLWQAIVAAGAHRWIPGKEQGGLGLDTASVLSLYGKLAEASLTAAFLLSQQDAAVRRLLPSSDRAHVASLLQDVVAGKTFVTVGISQLTTSTRLGEAAMRVRQETDGGLILDGAMPWVTGATRAEAFVTGGVLEDGRQVLVVVPRSRPGITVGDPLPLAALQASCTCEVQCVQVRIEPKEVLAGPSLEVMKIPGLAGTGGLETSALALGQARAALAALANLTTRNGQEHEPTTALATLWETLAADLLLAARQAPNAPPPAEIRQRANALVNRTAQAFLTARKGSGFLRTDPAQRWARQAMFFLVWSCPTPVAQASIRDLAGLCPL